MATYVINYAGSGAVSECISMDDALEIIEREYPDAVYGDWEPNGVNDADEPMDRMLVWPDEDTAGPEGSGDDGSHAVAEITRKRSMA